MYCTGGIRCEKASAWMKHSGFNKVWHIEGGIIEYARKAREQGLPVRFIGKNFVFDERMGSASLMKLSRIVINVAHRATAIPTAKMMVATCCSFSVRRAPRNSKAVVVRFAVKKARYRQKNSDVSVPGGKMAIRSLINHVDA